uniref:Uncharacterized protein n=1 Tax=Anguilla anguilla TaxID=7936 RepID=A0A0E9XPS9_ANGAN
MLSAPGPPPPITILFPHAPIIIDSCSVYFCCNYLCPS